jgi:hypothetical protein
MLEAGSRLTMVSLFTAYVESKLMESEIMQIHNFLVFLGFIVHFEP